MKTEVKKRNNWMNSDFSKGASSIINIYGPDKNEYFELFENSSKNAIKNHWLKVGDSIRTSIVDFKISIKK
jgi:hypothetical protein